MPRLDSPPSLPAFTPRLHSPLCKRRHDLRVVADECGVEALGLEELAHQLVEQARRRVGRLALHLMLLAEVHEERGGLVVHDGELDAEDLKGRERPGDCVLREMLRGKSIISCGDVCMEMACIEMACIEMACIEMACRDARAPPQGPRSSRCA